MTTSSFMETLLGICKTFQIPSVMQSEEEFNRKKEALDSLEDRAQKLFVTWSKAYQDLCAVLARKPKEGHPRFDDFYDFQCGKSEMSAGVICGVIKELISSIQEHAGHVERCFVNQKKCVWLKKNVASERADDPVKTLSFHEMSGRVTTLRFEIGCISNKVGEIFDFHPAGSCTLKEGDKICAASHKAIGSKISQLCKEINAFELYAFGTDDLDKYIARSSNKEKFL